MGGGWEGGEGTRAHPKGQPPAMARRHEMGNIREIWYKAS